MITKERLEELIKEKAEIYYIINKTFIAGYSSISEIMSYKLNEPDYYIVDDNCLCLMKIQNNEEDCCVYAWKLQELFETEEEAKWELEMTATYEDTLKLANYTDFENENGDRVFYHKGITYELSLWWASDNTKIIRITWRNGDDFGWLFEKPLTKENYIEACKLCLELFKGE